MTNKGSNRSGGGGRYRTEHVRTAKRRKAGSTRWLQRQLNDPYVQDARAAGYRSRAAFKLVQLDEKYKILKPGMKVVDLGAAPGGWTQVAVRAVRPKETGGKVVGIDYLGMDNVEGASVLELDFLDPSAPERLRALLGGRADLVMSDMAAPTTGHQQTDHLRIMMLAETAYAFAETVLAPGGAFIAKVFQGGAEKTLLDQLKRDFTKVAHAKPPASRQESAEQYVVALGFRGGAKPDAEQAPQAG